MKLKIGFTDSSNEEEIKQRTVCKAADTPVKSRAGSIPDRNMTLSYYNDKFDLHCGDLVLLTASLKVRGIVVDVSYNFKIGFQIISVLLRFPTLRLRVNCIWLYRTL